MPKRSPKVAPGPAEIPSPFHESYSHLLDGLPDSVVQKVKSRISARGLDLAVEADYLIIELLEGARSAYERKKEGSRASAARRRASKKALAAEVEPPAPEAAVDVEPPANP